MKDWFGILIFVAIAIANIMLEQNRQQKKKAARRPADPASPVPPQRKRVPVQRRTEVQSDRPATTEPTLQEALQSLFENSRMEPRKQVPPPVPLEPAKPPVRVVGTPAPAPVASPSPASAPAAPASRVLSKSDFRNRTSLRRAVLMSEILSKPRGFQ